MELFVQYCVPSMKAQISPPHRWLIYCDATSPDWFQTAIVTSLIELPYTEIVWVKGVYSLAYAQRDIQARLPEERPVRLITTRVDNDDAFVPIFMAEVQSAAVGVEHAFINFTHGAQIAGDRVYWLSDPANPFISFVEVLDDREQCQTVLFDEHEKAATHAPVHQLSTRPAWLQVVHGTNMDNAVRGVRARPARIRSAFPVRMAIVTPSPLVLMHDQFHTTVSLVTRLMQDPRRLKKLWRVVWSR